MELPPSAPQVRSGNPTRQPDRKAPTGTYGLSGRFCCLRFPYRLLSTTITSELGPPKVDDASARRQAPLKPNVWAGEIRIRTSEVGMLHRLALISIMLLLTPTSTIGQGRAFGPDETTHGRANGRAWQQLSVDVKIMYLYGIESGLGSSISASKRN